MKDMRYILIKALQPKLHTLTGLEVFTQMPYDKAAHPYVFISDCYQRENGSKIDYKYELDVQIQIVYKNVSTLSGLFTAMDNILSMIDNGTGGLTLDSPYKVLSCELGSSNTESFNTETGLENVGIIRINFLII